MDSFADFHDQFLLTRTQRAPSDQWQAHSCGEDWLFAHPSLPVRRLIDEGGVHVGFALGWLIDSHGSLAFGDIAVSSSSGRQAARAGDYGGRFAFLFLRSAQRRVYLDPLGSLAAVYSRERAAVASTVTALLWNEPEARSGLKRGAFPDDRPNQFYPAGLTGVAGVSRILPNHALNLDTYNLERVYPDLAALRSDDTGAATCEIATILRRQISAVSAHVDTVYLPLTAGRDTRMLLACAQPLAEKIAPVTFDYRAMRFREGWSSFRRDQIDRRSSVLLAQMAHLRSPVMAAVLRAPEAVSLRYLTRIGFAAGAGKARDFDMACRTLLDMRGAWLPGFGGELARLVYWRKHDAAKSSIDARTLLTRMGLPLRADFLRATDVWLNNAPRVARPALLALAYLENRIGAWAAPHLYGAAPFAIHLTPFSHRRIVDLMLGLPLEERLRARLASSIVAHTWPELNGAPYNQYAGGIARAADTALTALANARRNAGHHVRRWMSRRRS